jgi:hypothetical protein
MKPRTKTKPPALMPPCRGLSSTAAFSAAVPPCGVYLVPPRGLAHEERSPARDYPQPGRERVPLSEF